MTHLLAIALPLLLFVAFWFWWGGNGKPLSPDELEQGLQQLQATDTSEHGREAVEQVRRLLRNDDGKEFVMLNLVRHRAKALYPAGLNYGDDPKAADRRYGKSIVWDLLRNGNLMLFIAPRMADFIVPDGADEWHYVALVRYRSRRDFLRFAQQSSRADKFVHKWAAIEKTHVFAVRPMLSLFLVRTTVGLALALLSFALYALV
ncbi:hypothetical protein RQP54_12565 [Curvibacter sp. APW13]|uniref:hypothetical protein n=1 Tax=Curvibacter sp. APW13 TaxID=3077236 RepID=UPI0028E000A1|nr:hypothetical protein [Curvibacter sp. APW13]MDT8991695.1 hypothetical protein [Curvibacter sp. APW13]